MPDKEPDAVAGTDDITLRSGQQMGRPGSARGGTLQPRGSSDLITDHGRTSISDSVVQKIAGASAREISGVHAMGTGRTRAIRSLRERLPGSSGENVAQGVGVEVGEKQAAIDLDLVMDYGVSIVDVAQAVRHNVTRSVELMTGLEVVEVNITVDDIWMGDDSADSPRVQ